MGPTGAVLTALLAKRGLSVVVCDAVQDIYAKPRAIALDHEIMRVFQELGITQALAPFVEPFTDSEFYGVNGQLIKCMSTLPPPYPLGYVPSLVFSQPPLERVLREKVSSMPNAQIHLGLRLMELEQDAQRVRLNFEDQKGQAHAFEARYVVGCDGASSFVRQAVGIELEDLGFDQPWLVVDVLLNESGMAKLPKVSMQICEPKRPCTYVIGPKNHRRFEVAINEGEDPKEMQLPEKVWELLSRWMTPDDGMLWRQASYRFHALVAKDWRAQRVLIAGDAAHQQPPFLGQGMCQGVRDAHNLAWKLTQLIKGEGSESLLDSYASERAMHVRELTSRIKSIGLLVAERDEQKALERDEALLREAGGVVKPLPRQNVQPHLKNGCLSSSAHQAVGSIFPQATLSVKGTEVLMDEVLAQGWTLFVNASPSSAYRAFDAFALPEIEVVDCKGEHFRETTGVVSEWFQRMNVEACLVRPDHYVFGAFNGAEEWLGALNELRAIYEPSV